MASASWAAVVRMLSRLGRVVPSASTRWNTPLGTAVCRLPRLQYSMMIHVSTCDAFQHSSDAVRSRKAALLVAFHVAMSTSRHALP